MAILKEDCLLLLMNLKENGVDCDKQIKELIKQNIPSIEIITFINSKQQLSVRAFYEKLRKSYNNKKSNLYKNIVKENVDDVKSVLTTLASLNLQILLFLKHVDDEQMFLRQVRFDEINRCLLHYAKTYDFIPCQKLLRLIKADLKVLEYISKVE